MAKGIYFGVDNIARKCKKLYFGVDNIARKVKKMYFGVDGKARICYSAGISKNPTILTTSRNMAGKPANDASCATVGEYVLVGSATTMDTISKTLVRGSATPLGSARVSMGSASTSKYAFFVGGKTGYDYTSYTRFVEYYDSSLTKTFPNKYLENSRAQIGSGVIDDKAVFAGGVSEYTRYSTIDIIEPNASFNIISNNLPFRAYYLIGLNIGAYLLFAHGTDYNNASIQLNYAYLTTDLTVSQTGYVNTRKPHDTAYSSGAANSNYAIYQIGNYMDVFTTSLVYTELTNFPTNARAVAGLSTNEYAIFAGGSIGATRQTKVYTYDKNLVLDTLDDLSEARDSMLSAKLGDNGFFIGGYLPGSNPTTIDIYDL